MQVFLDYVMIRQVKIIESFREEYSSSLATRLRLSYECIRWRSAFFDVIPEIIEFSRQQPCLWEELVVFREILSHFHQIPREMVLPSQREHSWKMIDFLIWLHSSQLIWLYSIIRPAYIPINRFHVILQSPFEYLLANKLHYAIFCIQERVRHTRNRKKSLLPCIFHENKMKESNTKKIKEISINQLH